MKKFKVNMTLILTKSLSRFVEAENLQQAVKITLKEAKRTEWVADSELKINSK